MKIQEPICVRCGAPTSWPVAACLHCPGKRPPFVRARSAVLYESTAPAFVSAWKERGQRRLTAALGGVIENSLTAPEADLVTFVPGDDGRSLWRGYHAAAELAKELSRRWSVPCAAFLRRRPGLPRQRGLSSANRRENLKGAFEVIATPPAAVILVDDVFTTGTTIVAAARELRHAGASDVHVVTLARVLRH